LADSGGRLYVIKPIMKSSWGTGAIAALTAANNRSNSASLIALSRIRAPSVAKLLSFAIEQIAQIVRIRRSRAGLVTEMLTGVREICLICPLQRFLPVAFDGLPLRGRSL
jgi:hypothetical protein